MKQTPLTRRLGEQLREKLGYILLFEIADPRLELVTLTGVEVSQDRSFARVYVSCEGDRYEEVLATLNAAMFEIADPRLELVTLTGVEVSQDRSFARVYVSCEGDRYEEVLATLNAAKGRIRSLLAHSLDWRVTPELAFKIDRSTDEAEAITRALENVPATLAVEKDEFGYPVEADEPDGAPAEGPDGEGVDEE